ncbi:putative oxidoreductase CipA [Dactylonectria macrodidyma]|uniref:Oxidoreductase CipA n=1 Tax=Dactylonectria macrodidyma TaxID=307937 RepID=A0A9P9EEX7_9HYPO|nr:putative oxidoreductase CipA [Dactylonectria macrodidyma]
MAQSVERIAIVGASGQIGSYFAEELLKTGTHTVTAITRSASSTALPAGIKVATVDYDNQASLVTALMGQQFLIITMALTAPRDSQEKLIRAAAEASVPYVMPNWYGVDFANKELLADCPFPPYLTGTTTLVEELGVSSWVLLSCGMWYEYSLSVGLDTFGIDIKNHEVIWIDEGNTVINVSSYRQCGRAIAGLLSLEAVPAETRDSSRSLNQFLNNVVYISSFKLTQKDIFKSVKRTTGTTNEDWKFSTETAVGRWNEAASRIQKGDHSAFLKQLYSRVFFPDGSADIEGKRVLNNDALGLPLEDLDELTKAAVTLARTV